MSKHDQLDLLSAYLDGELDAADRAGIDDHLPECAECRRTLEALRATVGDLRSLEPVALDEVSAAFITDRVAEARRLAVVSPARSKATRRWGWAAGAAAAGLLAIGLLSLRDVSRQGGNSALRENTSGASDQQVTVLAGRTYDRASASAELAAFGTVAVDGSTERGTARSTSKDTLIPSPASGEYETGTAFTTAPPGLLECAEDVVRGADAPLDPQRYEVATFEGREAYVLFFVAPKGSPTRAEVWVLRPSDCFTLYWAQRPI